MAYRFLFPFLVGFVQGANDEPPNILFVLPDDLGMYYLNLDSYYVHNTIVFF